MLFGSLNSIKWINEGTCFNMITESGILNSNGKIVAFQLTLERPGNFTHVL